MPGVDIYYRHGVMSIEVADAIKEMVRRYGELVFSTPEIELSESDFSFKFHRPEKYDDLVKDLIVRIRLHHFPERLLDTDGKSKAIALIIGLALEQIEGFDPQHTIGVEILVGEVGWGTATPMEAKIADRLGSGRDPLSIQPWHYLS